MYINTSFAFDTVGLGLASTVIKDGTGKASLAPTN